MNILYGGKKWKNYIFVCSFAKRAFSNLNSVWPKKVIEIETGQRNGKIAPMQKRDDAVTLFPGTELRFKQRYKLMGMFLSSKCKFIHSLTELLLII